MDSERILKWAEKLNFSSDWNDGTICVSGFKFMKEYNES